MNNNQSLKQAKGEVARKWLTRSGHWIGSDWWENPPGTRHYDVPQLGLFFLSMLQGPAQASRAPMQQTQPTGSSPSAHSCQPRERWQGVRHPCAGGGPPSGGNCHLLPGTWRFLLLWDVRVFPGTRWVNYRCQLSSLVCFKSHKNKPVPSGGWS